MITKRPVENCDCPSCEYRRKLGTWHDAAAGGAMILAFIALVVLMVGGWQ